MKKIKKYYHFLIGVSLSGILTGYSVDTVEAKYRTPKEYYSYFYDPNQILGYHQEFADYQKEVWQKLYTQNGMEI